MNPALEKLLAHLEALTQKVDALAAQAAAPAPEPTAPAAPPTSPAPSAPSAPASVDADVLAQLNEVRVNQLLIQNKVPESYAALLRKLPYADAEAYLSSPQYLNRRNASTATPASDSTSAPAATPPENSSPNPIDAQSGLPADRLKLGIFTAEEEKALAQLIL